MLWQINSRNGLLLNLAAASIWLSHVIHPALLLPSKILMFFIICLLTSFCSLSLLTCARICVNASVMLADGIGDVPLKGVCDAVLILGIWFSNRFWNKCPLLVVLGCCVGCPPVDVTPISGGGVAVGWYPVGMWLFSGLGVLFRSFLQTLMSWFAYLQFVQ